MADVSTGKEGMFEVRRVDEWVVCGESFPSEVEAKMFAALFRTLHDFLRVYTEDWDTIDKRARLLARELLVVLDYPPGVAKFSPAQVQLLHREVERWRAWGDEIALAIFEEDLRLGDDPTKWKFDHLRKRLGERLSGARKSLPVEEARLRAQLDASSRYRDLLAEEEKRGALLKEQIALKAQECAEAEWRASGWRKWAASFVGNADMDDKQLQELLDQEHEGAIALCHGLDDEVKDWHLWAALVAGVEAHGTSAEMRAHVDASVSRLRAAQEAWRRWACDVPGTMNDAQDTDHELRSSINLSLTAAGSGSSWLAWARGLAGDDAAGPRTLRALLESRLKVEAEVPKVCDSPEEAEFLTKREKCWDDCALGLTCPCGSVLKPSPWTGGMVCSVCGRSSQSGHPHTEGPL